MAHSFESILALVIGGKWKIFNNDGFVKSRHTREGGYPERKQLPEKEWIPVFTGMTKRRFPGLYYDVVN